MSRLSIIAIAALVGIFVLLWSAPARPVIECRPLDDILAEARTHHSLVELDVMTPEMSRLYVEEARKITPGTRLGGHRLAVFSSRAWPAVVIVGVTGDGLVCGDSAITRAALSLHMLVMRRAERRSQ